THQSSLTQNIARISYPKMPDGKTVTKYMYELWENLANLIKDVGSVVKEIPN
ncbi:MAG: hypothetical protein H0X03_00200, partial [Nitrosopumilus sp.]|nr:hypothetical protein [Nitrosopumilus sp.]